MAAYITDGVWEKLEGDLAGRAGERAYIRTLVQQEAEHERAVLEQYVTFSKKVGRSVKKLAVFRAESCSESCVLHKKRLTSEEYNTSFLKRFPVPNRDSQAARSLSLINSWQTRILILKPGSFGEVLKIDLCTVDLVNGPGAIHHEKQFRIEYEALSYFWGDPEPVQSIECDGVPCPVSRNLYSALQRLRLIDRERYLWIDALCINQSDPEERSMQVSNMLLIYQKARKVIVWLGEQRGYTAVVMDCFNLSEPAICNIHISKIFDGLLDLLSRPWFRRVWVKQEVWAANEIEVICGNTMISWDIFEIRVNQFFSDIDYWATAGFQRRSAIFVHKRSEWRLNYSKEQTRWTDWVPPEIPGLEIWFLNFQNPLSGLRRASKTHRALIGALAEEAEGVHALLRSSNAALNPIRDEAELLKVLIRTSNAECTDLRDHVYAVLGMTGVSHGSVSSSNASGRRGIVIDYNLSIAQVYQDVIRYYLARDSSLWIFNALLDSCYRCQGLRFGSIVANEKLPSWCPNWSIGLNLNVKDEDLALFRGTNEVPWGQHGFASELRTKCSFPFSDIRDNVLRLSGLTLQAVKFLVGNMPMLTEKGQVQTWQFETYKYPQASILPWVRGQPDEKVVQLKDLFKRLSKLGDSARRWCMRGRTPNKEDILVAVEGSLAPLVLRRRELGFEFLGIAVNMREETNSKSTSSKQAEMVSKAFDAIQDLLIAAKQQNLLETFHLV